MQEGAWNIGNINIPDFGLSETLLGAGKYKDDSLGITTTQTSGDKKTSSIDWDAERARSDAQLAELIANRPQTLSTSTGPTVPQTSSTQITSTSSGSSSSGSSGPSAEELKRIADAEKKAAEEAEKKRIEAWKKEERSQINSTYDDLFSQLDSLLGMYPGQQEEMMNYVNQLAGSQSSIVESQRQRGIEGLEGQKTEQEQLATKSLRSLEEDIRNSLTAAGRYLGVRGAADSSAAGQMSEALAKAAQKGKSSIFELRNQAVQEIGLKINEINAIASEQLLNVDKFKAEKALDIATFFQSKIEALEAQRMGATERRGEALRGVIQNTQTQFIEAMRALDAETRQYKQSIDMWSAQRAAEMEDYAQKLAISKSYSGASGADYNQAVAMFDSLVSRGMTEDQARDYINSELGYMLPAELQREDEYGDWVSNFTPLTINEEGVIPQPYNNIVPEGDYLDISGIDKVIFGGK